MAGVYKRASDKKRGKAGKWTVWWLDEAGTRRSKAGYTDRARSLELARHLEGEARRVREGLAEPGERSRREAARKPPADHAADYRLGLLARGDTAKHAGHAAGAVRRLLADAGVASVADLDCGLVQEALGRLRAKRSPRTANHALAALKSFYRWLEHSNRIREVPRGLQALKPFSEAVDRRRVRRALTPAEVERLLAAAEAGPPLAASRGPRKGKRSPPVWITGPERAALYRLAMGTGFRARELRTLTPERLDLDGSAPTVTVLACYAKNGREAVQPIRRELAERLRPFVAGRDPGRPLLVVPDRTAAMLRRDLEAAGIPYRDAAGRVADFHALRHSYITHLVAAGVNPKTVQLLARHSSITLTLDRYTHVERGDLRDAIEGKAGGGGPRD